MIHNEKSNEAQPYFGVWEAYKTVMGGFVMAQEQNMRLAGRLAGESMRLYVGLLPAPGSSSAPSAQSTENLPIQGYDRLTVEEVTTELKDLRATEVEQLRTHEVKNKNRAVLLEKFDRSLV